MTRRRDPADGDGDRNWSGAGRHHLVANPDEHAFGGDRHVVGRAVAQYEAEFVAGVAAERVLAAHSAAQALSHRANRLFGDVEAVRFIDARQIIDRDQEKSAGRAETQGFLDRIFENFAQVMAVQFAGETVVTGEISEPALVLIPLIDDAQHAVRPHRPAAGAGKPAAGILDPQLGFVTRDRDGCNIGSDRQRHGRRRVCPIA